VWALAAGLVVLVIFSVLTTAPTAAQMTHGASIECRRSAPFMLVSRCLGSTNIVPANACPRDAWECLRFYPCETEGVPIWPGVEIVKGGKCPEDLPQQQQQK
jgi:hypothetical protein